MKTEQDAIDDEVDRMVIIADEGDGYAKIEMDGQSKVIKANVLKLMNTFYNKTGEKYTEEEMEELGFERKKK